MGGRSAENPRPSIGSALFNQTTPRKRALKAGLPKFRTRTAQSVTRLFLYVNPTYLIESWLVMAMRPTLTGSFSAPRLRRLASEPSRTIKQYCWLERLARRFPRDSFTEHQKYTAPSTIQLDRLYRVLKWFASSYPSRILLEYG